MRCFSLLALACAAMLDTSSALVDAGTRTTVTTYANAYDKRTSGSGCSPSGCKPSLVRDNSLADASRWSCNYDLEHEDCKLCLKFKDRQDIVRIRVAFHKGDTRKRSFYVDLDGKYEDEQFSFTSSGKTTGYENFYLHSDETKEMCITAKDLDDDDWLSITEVKVMVE